MVILRMMLGKSGQVEVWGVEDFIAELNDYIDWYNNGRIRCDLGACPL